MQRVCVFAGSSAGGGDAYRRAAVALGEAMAGRKLDLVYGGARVGLMGVVADVMKDAGREVIGVIPQALVDLEVAHHGIDDLRIVGSMHERKALMADLADGFVALPGGLGTCEELFETLTWAQLGLHAKPCGLLNVAGYFDPLRAFMRHAVAEGFVRDEHDRMVLVADGPAALLDAMAAYQSPVVDKWIDRETR